MTSAQTVGLCPAVAQAQGLLDFTVMKLQQALKVSLDGLLMQMLGVQVLFGFQFQGLFQDNFETLPTSARMVDAAGLGMMVVALGLMIAVPCQHRIVEEGETTPRIYASSVWYAQRAFLPLAVAISCDLWVALTILFGEGLAALAGSVGAFAFVAMLWFVLPLVLRKRHAASTAVAMRH